MDYKTCPSLPAMFFAEAARRGDAPFLWAKRDGAYAALSWRQAAERVGGQLSHAEIHRWDDVLARGVALEDDVMAAVAQAARDDTACLIYTSGTGGVPKGVMLSHANILANCHGAYEILKALGLGHEVFLCFLPLSHSYEHTAGLMFPISLGAQIYFAEAADTLAANMLEARPTIMTAVPRLYETMHQRILRGMERQSPFRSKLFMRALALGGKRY